MDEINAVQLLPKITKELNFTKCLICQSNKKSEPKLTSTSNGRSVIINAFKHLGDNSLSSNSTEDVEKIKYHVNSCYASLKKKAERLKAVPTSDSGEATNIEDVSADVTLPITRKQSGSSKRDKSIESLCIICNCVKKKDIRKRHGIGQSSCAWQFLAAINFYKDDVYRRCIFCNTAGDIFAADICYHDNCLKGYFSQFDRDLKT